MQPVCENESDGAAREKTGISLELSLLICIQALERILFLLSFCFLLSSLGTPSLFLPPPQQEPSFLICSAALTRKYLRTCHQISNLRESNKNLFVIFSFFMLLCCYLNFFKSKFGAIFLAQKEDCELMALLLSSLFQ
jgi:hypothetical protein